MKIRFATLDDVPLLVELGRRFHAMTRFRDYDHNAERVAQNLHAVIESGQNGKGNFGGTQGTGQEGDRLTGGAANDYNYDLERSAA